MTNDPQVHDFDPDWTPPNPWEPVFNAPAGKCAQCGATERSGVCRG